MHVEWPLLLTYFWFPWRKVFVLGVIYTSLVAWAAMYLNHHFLVDIIGSVMLASFAFVFGLFTLSVAENYIWAKAVKREKYSEKDLICEVVVDSETHPMVQLEDLSSSDSSSSSSLTEPRIHPLRLFHQFESEDSIALLNRKTM